MTKDYCLFCDRGNTEKHTIFLENTHFWARWSNYPVTEGHTEIVAKEHIPSFFELSNEQVVDMYQLLKKVQRVIQEKFTPDGYNIGINEGDVSDPRGGVRNVIPEKGNYMKQ